MKYSDLVKCTAAKAGVTQSEAKVSLDAAMKVIAQTLKSEGEVTLNGVGKLIKKVRPARVGINPTTMQKVNIPETTTAVFKVAKELKDHLNS